ncbi:hypothetical protein GCM10010286_64410 [Streptomyces toxytricini]|nr:hypothetical protein GCM10010286_64410 [Streptomyces toxytricini]
MARTVYTTGQLTDEQIDGLYALAKECGVGIYLWGNTPGPPIASPSPGQLRAASFRCAGSC